MRSSKLLTWFVPSVAVVAIACSGIDRPSEPTLGPALFAVGPPPGCTLPYLTSGILQPVNADNSSSFQLGRTVPLKIRVTDCVSGEGINTLAPTIALTLLDLGGTPVNEVVSSSAADDGTTMRSAGNGQYIFNLSTKRSQFNAGQDLIPGMYQLTISSPGVFADVVVQFAIRP